MFKKSATLATALAAVAMLAYPAAAVADDALPDAPVIEEAAPVEEPPVVVDEPAPVVDVPAEEAPAPVTEAPAPEAAPPVDKPSHPVVVAPTPQTKTLKWTLPNGGTPDNVTWPQPVFDAGSIPCGSTVWVQVDVYPYTTPEDQARTDALDDDGVLTYGEDHGWAKSWTFEEYSSPACIPVLPPNPKAELSASCGVATINLANPQEDGTIVQTASFVVLVDGEFYDAYSVEGMGGLPVQVAFDEDSGDHVVEVYQSGISEWALLGSVNVPSDCIAPLPEPETPAEPEEPVTAPPAAEPAAVVQDLEPVKAATTDLAETGADPGVLWTFGAIAAALLTAGSIALSRRKA